MYVSVEMSAREENGTFAMPPASSVAIAAMLVLTLIGLLGCRAKQGTEASAQEKKAIALLSQPRFQAPAGWYWGTMQNADGARLRFGATPRNSASRGLVVFAPSFQAPAEQYFETAQELARAGYVVWIMDRRGQGGSESWPRVGPRAHLDGGQREARDLAQFALLARDSGPDLPRFVVGESLGGLIGLRVLHDMPKLFVAAAFSSPAIDFQTGGIPRGVARSLTTLLSSMGLGSAYALGQHDWSFDPKSGGLSDPVKDDSERALAAQGWLLLHPELREGGATNRFVKTLFEEADLEERAGWANEIGTPTLFGMTNTDKIARPDVMLRICRAMAACEIQQFEGARHSLFSDADATRSAWLRTLIEFLDKSIGLQPRAGMTNEKSP